MPAHERILFYDPSAQETATSDSKTITIPDPSKFQSRGYQCLDIPPLCNTITIYIDWEGPSGSHTVKEPVKFALSRSRRKVQDSDLVATISLKKQQNNSWLPRHLPLQPSPFRKIVIGPIGDRIKAVKDESASARDKPESPKDRSNS
ncbi:hypothetical protein GGR51DRAFT_331655 [Nemania sp. FL0031]|nr:hypothetical protein GGR51DRAFT_331655 [Nemania sp. FL0031]